MTWRCELSCVRAARCGGGAWRHPSTAARRRQSTTNQSAMAPKHSRERHELLAARKLLKWEYNRMRKRLVRHWCLFGAKEVRFCCMCRDATTLYHNKRTRPLTIHHFIRFSLLFFLPVHLFCLSCPAARFAFSLPAFAIGYSFFCLLLLSRLHRIACDWFSWCCCFVFLGGTVSSSVLFCDGIACVVFVCYCFHDLSWLLFLIVIETHHLLCLMCYVTNNWFTPFLLLTTLLSYCSYKASS